MIYNAVLYDSKSLQNASTINTALVHRTAGTIQLI